MSRRTWRILFVAYPMLAVSETACGGAEQMLWTLESEMARRGHVTAVAACDGSRIAGRLIATGGVPEQPDRYDERNAEHQAVILAHLAQTQSSLQPYDLVHDKSGSFWRCAGQADAPVLATLHLPRAMYGGAFRDVPGNVWFNGVSEAQARTLPDLPQLAGMVRNGVRTRSFPPPADRREDYLLWLGRICEEKAPHLAIEVARRAGLRLAIARLPARHRNCARRERHPLKEVGLGASPGHSFSPNAILNPAGALARRRGLLCA